MPKNKWIYDSSTDTYHNTDYFMELSVDKITSYEGEEVHHIEGLRVDGRYVQITSRVKSPGILHDIIRSAIGEVEDG